MSKYILYLTVVTVVLSSCTMMGSLNALSENEHQFVFRKEFIGKWNDLKDVHESYYVDTVAGSFGKLYTIKLVTKREGEANLVDTVCFIGRLIQVGEGQFLDCKMDGDKMFPPYKNVADLVITKHFIIETSFKGSDKIELTAPDPDELMKLIKAGKIKLHYTKVKKDDYLILDSSAELQRATEALKKYPEVYKHKTVLLRSR